MPYKPEVHTHVDVLVDQLRYDIEHTKLGDIGEDADASRWYLAQQQALATAYLAQANDRIATALESIVGNHTVPHIDPDSARALTKQLKDQLKAAREQS